MKLFSLLNTDVTDECRLHFDVVLPIEMTENRRVKFKSKSKFANSNNLFHLDWCKLMLSLSQLFIYLTTCKLFFSSFFATGSFNTVKEVTAVLQVVGLLSQC